MIETTKIQSLERVEYGNDPIALRTYVDGKSRFYIFKRLFDIVVSLFAIVFILSWMIPLLAIIIKLESKGSIFFIQKRVGKGGKSFFCIKFRTMYANKEANTKQAKDDDSRITSIGKFLRTSNLDEFPQFINVLLGSMTIVGPRPHMHADCTRFSSVVNQYKFRNLVKPGITGLAQVKGYRGPTNDFMSVFHRYQFDAFYVRNANFWLDMRIIRLTAAQTLSSVFGKFLGTFSFENQAYKKLVTSIRSFLI